MSKKSELRDKNSIARKSQNCEIKTQLREKSQNCEIKTKLREKLELRDKNS